MPPSASLAEAEQVRVLLVVTPVGGEMLTAETTGSVFSTVTEALSLSVPPSLSVAVAVQVTVSLGETVEGVSARLAPVPSEPPPLAHA